MMDWLRALCFDRRKKAELVGCERRRKVSKVEADERLQRAMERLNIAVTGERKPK